MDEYERLATLGSGTYGIVYKPQHKKIGEVVAIKKIRMHSGDEGIPGTAIREVSLLKELKHPNIINLQDVHIESTRLSLIFEFIPMDFVKYIQTFEDKPMPFRTVKSLLYQLLLAILFCHHRRILHRDLKPQNLLIDPKTGILKIGDFGLGRAVSVPVRKFSHEIVALWYRAPEILLGTEKYAGSVDIWSVGCIFAELVNLKPLFPGDSEIDQLFKIFRILTTPNDNTWAGISLLPDYKLVFPKWTKNLLKTVVENLDTEGFHLLEQLLKYDPKARIGAKDAVNHPYFDDLDKNKFPAKPYDP